MRAISVSLPVRFVLAVLPPVSLFGMFPAWNIRGAAKFLFSNSVLGQVDCDLGRGGQRHTCLGSKYGQNTTQICWARYMQIWGALATSNMFVLGRKVALIFGTSGDKKSLANSENNYFCTGRLYVQPIEKSRNRGNFKLMLNEFQPWFNANGKGEH